MQKVFFLLLGFIFFSCNTSDKTAKPTSEKAGPVNEKSFISLGGEEQYVEMTGASSDNPLLLFLHGGPGWPQTPHLRYFNEELTRSMTVVAWEQSGCGQSFLRNPDPKNLTMEQVISDAHELTQLLKKKFSKKKIYLAGFSWGSIIGLQLIQKYPEDYAAYFGISQVLSVRQNIAASREWIMKKAKEKNDNEALHILERLGKGDTSLCKRDLDCFLTQYQLLSKFGGAIYSKNSEDEIKKAETRYEDYKNYDWFAAFQYSAYRLEKALFDTDLTAISEVKIPIYFLAGRHDWNIPAAITFDFFQRLSAPEKEFIWFEESGHEPLEEEAAKFNKVLIERIKN